MHILQATYTTQLVAVRDADIKSVGEEWKLNYTALCWPLDNIIRITSTHIGSPFLKSTVPLYMRLTFSFRSIRHLSFLTMLFSLAFIVTLIAALRSTYFFVAQKYSIFISVSHQRKKVQVFGLTISSFCPILTDAFLSKQTSFHLAVFLWDIT